MTAKMIIKQALKLNVKERVRVYAELEKSLESQWLDPNMPEWHKRELELSLKDSRENPGDFITWEELKKKLNRRRRKR